MSTSGTSVRMEITEEVLSETVRQHCSVDTLIIGCTMYLGKLHGNPWTPQDLDNPM